MKHHLHTLPALAVDRSASVERNRVLRNPYWLLSLSMIPTVLGIGGRRG
ncbi:hypothetical protein ABIC90_005010 [Variovorax boronicumulans]